ncbi:response regulator transcription factor [Raoultibacter phocaeensis]|uniref:response regulator transcription factor n=1 Tax=Raoultibacter phocaeensis TaxID=2479841 RepID=UPI0015D59B8F|nr:LuxR C-terminal-related transcriptional regulator [Raoultibacter phocaeensis]
MEKLLDRFTGNISPIALLVSSFYWSWFDVVPFSPALFSAAGAPADALPLALSLAVSVIVLGVLALHAPLRSRIVTAKAFALNSLVCGAGGSLLLYLGAQAASVPLLVAGSVLVGIYQGAGIVTVGGLITCEGTTNALVHIATALPFNLLAILFVMFLQPLPSVVFALSLPLASAACYAVFTARKRNRALVEALANETMQRKRAVRALNGTGLARYNPRFLAILLVVCCSFGFVNYRTVFEGGLGGSDLDYLSLGIRALVSFAVLVGYIRYSQRPYSILRYALLFMTLGLLASPSLAMLGEVETVVPECLFLAGYTCFDLVIWAIIIILSKKANLSLLKTICIVDTLDQLGIFIGTAFGITCEGSSTALVACIVLGGLLLMLMLGFTEKRDPVNDDLNALEVGFAPSAEEGKSSTAPEPSPRGSAISPNEAIEELAGRHFLTKREAEVLSYLIEGRSGPYISERLCVSENTVKSHVRHIYTKLDVHNRQELIDLVLDR